MDINQLRQKLPHLAQLDDAHLIDVVQRIYYPKVDKATLAERLGVKVEAPMPEEPGLLRSVGDSGVALGRGLVSGVKMVSDAFGADNAVSEALGGARDSLSTLESDYRKAERQRRAQRIQEADESGSTWESIKANLGALREAPLDTLLEAAGTMAPTVAMAAIPGLGQANLARTVATAGMGAVQGAGVVKGEIYEAVERRLLEAGVPPEEAAARAAEAQAYDGPNQANIAAGAGLGAAAGSTGIERIIGRGGATGGLAGRVAAGTVAEGIPEAVQGGQERYASNVALQREGFEVPTWQGVAGQAALEGAAGGLLGGGVSAFSSAPVEPAPNDGPLTRAVKAGGQDPAAPVVPPVVDAPAGQEPGLSAAGLTEEQEAAALSRMEAQAQSDLQGLRDFTGRSTPEVVRRGVPTKRPTQPQPGEEGAAQFVPDAAFSDRLLALREQLADERVREQVRERFGDDALNEITYYTSLADRPDVDLPDLTRSRLLELAERGVGEALLRPIPSRPNVGANQRPEQIGATPGVPQIGLDTAPTGTIRVDGAGRAAPETRADQIRTRQGQNEAAAERQRRNELGLTPDVEAAQARMVRPGDTLNPSGEPFKTRMAADRAAKKEGGAVVPVEGGFVVRKEQANDVAMGAGRGPGGGRAARGADAGRGVGADGRPADEPRGAVPGRVPADAAPAAAGGARPAGNDAALTEEALTARYDAAKEAGDSQGMMAAARELSALRRRAQEPQTRDVQDAPTRARKPKTQAPAGQARAAVEGNAARAPGPADAGAPAVQADGVEGIARAITASISEQAMKRSLKGLAENVSKGRMTQAEADRRAEADAKMWATQKPNDRTLAIAKAIAEKDPTVLVAAWAKDGQGIYGNEGSMEAFRKLTGINLKRLNSAERAKAIFDWAGWSEDRVRADVEKRKAARADAAAKRAMGDAEKTEGVASRTPLKVQGQEGETTVKAYIDDLISRGFTEIRQSKVGAITKTYLFNPATSSGYPMSKGILSDYAKIASSRAKAARATTTTEPASRAEGADVTRPEGQPFATKMAAQREVNKRGLSDSHEVVPVTGGFIARAKTRAVDEPQGSGPTRAGDESTVTPQQPEEATPEAVGTHKDPGEPAEPVTRAVVSEAITKAAAKRDRKPSDMRAELLAMIDAKLPEAKDEYLPTWKEPTKGRIREAMLASGLTSEARVVRMLEQQHENRVAEAADRIGYVTFKVPGDGTFKVLNTKSKLEDFRKRVSASPGFRSPARTPAPEGSAGGERGYGGAAGAIMGMIDEGDPQAAVDYAAARALDITEVLKGDKERLGKVAGLTPTAEAVGEFEPEAVAPAQPAADSATTDAQQAAPAPEPAKTPIARLQDEIGRAERKLENLKEQARKARAAVNFAKADEINEKILILQSELKGMQAELEAMQAARGADPAGAATAPAATQAEQAPDDLALRHAAIDAQLDAMSDEQVREVYRRANLAGERRPVEQLRATLKQEHPDDIEPLLDASDPQREDAAAAMADAGRGSGEAAIEAAPPAEQGTPSERTRALAIVKAVGRERPFDNIGDLRTAAGQRVRDELGKTLSSIDGLRSGVFTDDVLKALRDGQYEAIQDLAARLPVPVSETQIGLALAIRAFEGTSHTPQERGRAAVREYVRMMVDAWRRVEAQYEAADEQGKARVLEEFTKLRDGYASRVRAYLASHGQVMSAMIVGPARFPTERNRKRSQAADNKAQEAQDFFDRQMQRVRKAAVAPLDRSPQSELQRLKANLAQREQEQERMKAANAALRKGDDEALRRLGFSDAHIAELKKPDFAGRVGYADYELKNNNAEIRRLRERIEQAEGRVQAAQAGPKTQTFEGVRIEEHAEDDRLRLYFDGKPDDAVRDDLKANGFKWSPRAGAWQRQLTDNARHAARRLLEKHFGDASAAGGADVNLSIDDGAPQADTGAYVPASPEHQQLADELSGRLGTPGLLRAVDPAGRGAAGGDGRGGQGVSAQSRLAAAVRTIAKLIFGHEVVFVEFDGAPLFNGAMSDTMPGVVFINARATKPLMSVLGHELLHQMRNSHPSIYNQLRNRLDKLLKNEALFVKALEAKYAAKGKSTAGVNFGEELRADIVGDFFMDPEFWAAMAKDQPGLFRRVANAIIKFLDDVAAKIADIRPFGTDQYLTDIAAARAAVVDAMRQFSGAQVGAMTSQSEGISLSVAEARSVTDTPEFKRWFGDSKVVDAEGKPLVVYHGTKADIRRFDPSLAGTNTDSGGWGRGIYFTEDADYAAIYAGRAEGSNILPAYVALKNPMVVDVGARSKVIRELGLEYPGGNPSPEWSQRFADAVKARGHDGVLVTMGGKPAEIVAFRPEQIKSAIGNRGTFDPNDPRINFSIADDSLAHPVDSWRANGPQAARQFIEDTLTSQRGFNRWWHRTIGTQFHKSRINPYFRRTYEAVQRYLQDTSRMANAAADEAPDLLLRIESLSDLKKMNPKDADLKAAGEAIFGGTLVDEKVYTDAELKAKGLTDKQIGYYRQFRAAVDRSLDHLVATDVIRLMTTQDPQYLGRTKGEAAANLDALKELAVEDPGAVRGRLEKLILDRIAEIQAGIDGQPNQHTPGLIDKRQAAQTLLGDVREKFNRIQQLKEEGYAPLMRFGQYTVDVVDAEGERIYFGMYESQREANKAAREFRAMEGVTVRQGVQSQKEFEALKGLSPETVMLFAEMTGMEKNEAMQAWLKEAVAQQSALKRHIKRKGIAGFNPDLQRVLAAFVTSNARAASQNLHNLEVAESVESIPQSLGDVKDEALKLAQYVQNPQEEAQTIRSLMFVNYIGGSVASAMVNLSQTLVQTFPYLAQFGGAGKAAARITAAMKDAATRRVSDPDLRAAIARAEKDGVIRPQEIFQLQAEASRNFGSNPWVRKTLTVWGSMFQLAEQFNRRTAFIAAYRTAQEQGIANPFEFAENAVAETQSVFNKGNRPNWARGAVGATLFTFKTFSIQYVEFLKRLPPKERALALAILVAAAGSQGLPFAEDLQDVIDSIAQGMGYQFSSKRAMNAMVARTLGQGAADFLQHGFSTLPGVPLDVSARLGLGNLLPGTGVLKASETRKEDEVLETFGVAGSFVRDALKGEVRPIALRNAAKALDMYQTGMYRDTRGRRVTDVDTVDAVLKGLGLQPAGVAQESRAVGAEFDARTQYNKVRGEIAEQWALGIFEGDTKKVQAARDRLADWNTKNPQSPMRIDMPGVTRRVREMRKTRAERFVQSTNRDLRPAVRETLQ